MQVRHCEPQDLAQVCEIYNHYIAHTTITFEEQALSVQEMTSRWEAYCRLYPWLVCLHEGAVVGYAYATKWRERAAYRHTAEATVYIKAGCGGRGFGRALYAALLPALAQQGCHVVLGCIALPNEASVGLHERMGFSQVANFPEVGRKFDRWLDVGYWQLQLPDQA